MDLAAGRHQHLRGHRRHAIGGRARQMCKIRAFVWKRANRTDIYYVSLVLGFGKGVHIVLSQGTAVFVVSDLHMGDRSRMDNLHRAGRESLFNSFLSYVERQNGQLIILGDFFELLRYPMESILVQRRDLLDHLAAMKAVYVPGNHDEDAFSLVDPYCPLHPFFTRITDAFTQRIGDRRFRFMHGHEIDPLVNAGWRNLGRMIGAMTHRYELRQESRATARSALGQPLASNDPIVRLRVRLRRRVNKALQEGHVRTSAEKVRLLTRQIRTQHMITHYCGDRAEDLYDVVIVGHTHHAAAFGDWFFNSGSWTGRSSDFLTISPKGEVEVLRWTSCGPQLKDEILAA